MKPIIFHANHRDVRLQVGAGTAVAYEQDGNIVVMPILMAYDPSLPRIKVWLLGDAAEVHADYEKAIRTCAAISALWEADSKKRSSIVASVFGDGAEKEAA